MNIQTFVALALENRTPDQKVELMSRLTKKDPAAYAHLDNGRKSMTAGNVLRGACKNAAFRTMLAAECGLTDLDLDESPPVPSTPLAPRSPTNIARHRSEPVPCTLPSAGDGSLVVPVGCGAYFAMDVLTGAYISRITKEF